MITPWRVRSSEWVVFAFFIWSSILAAALPLSSSIRVRTFVSNALLFVAYYALSRMRKFKWAHIVRDWIPQALIVLAYKEMGWFAPDSHTHRLEQQWIVLDRVLLNDWHLRSIIESLGPVLPSLLEFSYVLVYALPPVTMLIIYRLGLQKRADTMLTIYLLGMLLCYAQFPFWPSEPPRVVFSGQDMPSLQTPIRMFSMWIVEGYGIHTSVFPSAHVAGAVAAALGMRFLVPDRKLLVMGYFVYAALVTVATVYGRYHYAVDALAGIVVGGIAFPLGLWFSRLRAES